MQLVYSSHPITVLMVPQHDRHHLLLQQPHQYRLFPYSTVIQHRKVFLLFKHFNYSVDFIASVVFNDPISFSQSMSCTAPVTSATTHSWFFRFCTVHKLRRTHHQCLYINCYWLHHCNFLNFIHLYFLVDVRINANNISSQIDLHDRKLKSACFYKIKFLSWDM